MTAITKWDGNPISVPGIYSDVQNGLYHEQLTISPSISSSGLRKLDSESPLHFFDDSYLNPNREPREPQPHFTIGTAIHSLLLGESGFRERFAVRPEEWKNWQTKASKEWRDAIQESGRDVLTPEDLDVIRGIAASVQHEPLVRQGLFNGIAEASMVWQDPETGVWLKSRPDVLLPDADMMVDLKTIASADGISCRRAIADHGYYVQLALAAEGYEILTGRQMPNDGFLLFFVEKKRPFGTNVKPVAPEAIAYGRQVVRRAVRTFAKCLDTGEWGGYADSGVTAYLPGWIENRLKADDEAGLLPAALDTSQLMPRKAA